MIQLSDFIQELKSKGTQDRAKADQRYHKSNREHFGVSVPICAQMAKAAAKELDDAQIIVFAKNLWDTNLFDPMMCSAKLLTLTRIKPSPALWSVLNHCLQAVDGWALEDCLAHTAWKCILANEALLDEVEQWTKHPNFWMRRAALVYTLPFAKKGFSPERMLGWASLYASDPEWFIQKSIGWWLRVLGEHNPERVISFLQGHWTKLKGVARKEATRKLNSTFIYENS